MPKSSAARLETGSDDHHARLRELFPDAFTEDGIDWEVLSRLLDSGTGERAEGYGLTWPGKQRARRLAGTAAAGTLRARPGDSVDWEATRNVVIEGDNLEVLKLLQKSYAAKVKLIYIDPPYNTGKEFVFRDRFRARRRGGRAAGAGGRRLSSTPGGPDRSHAEWLNMMYPRLTLARTLLRTDGLLVASISDAELHNLRHVLDEIFGEENFIGNAVWHSTRSVTNTALISVSHTHHLIYARSREYFIANRRHFRLAEDGSGFTNPDGDPRGPWKADPFQVGGERPNQLYPITNPRTGVVYRPNPGCSWKNEHAVFQRLLDEQRIVFGATGEAGPQRKRFLSEAEERGRVAKTLWDDVGTTTRATRALKELMGAAVFDNPKPVDLIARCLQLGTHDPQDAIVLDFFAGSGTTGHAVMAQNAADGGRRRFVLVQLPEPLEPESRAQREAAAFCHRLGKPATIAELTKERLRRAGRQLGSRALEGSSVDVGFRVFTLQRSDLRASGREGGEAEQAPPHLDPGVQPSDADADALCELLLRHGLELGVRIERQTIAGCTVYCVGEAELLVCLAAEIPGQQVEPLGSGIVAWRQALAPPGPTACVFRSSAFPDDGCKAHLLGILRGAGLHDVRSL